MQSFLVPNPTELKSIAKNIVPENELEDVENLHKNEEVKNTVLKQMTNDERAAGLYGYEVPEAIYLESNSFTIGKDLLTPILKVKRHQAKQYYADQITAMYAVLNQNISPPFIYINNFNRYTFFITVKFF